VAREKNPFEELYVGEMVSDEHFVDVFSPKLMDHALAMFKNTHVVVQGTEGAGKTMLLALLKPEVRVAYYRRGIPFPAPDDLSTFIGAGMSLRRSAAADFGQRLPKTESEDPEVLAAIYFGDFLNYWLVRDMLNSADTLGTELEGAVGRGIGMGYSAASMDEAAKRIAVSDVWQGYLDGVTNREQLEERLRGRIADYRRYLNYSSSELPNRLAESISPIGEPISVAASALIEAGVVSDETSVYVRIDEYDQLSRIGRASSSLGANMRQMVNKALSLRDPRVKYRIGTRPYGWRDTLVFGTSYHLEKARDFDLLDIDDILQRVGSSEKQWLFPVFAEDVISRRLRRTESCQSPLHDDVLVGLFGESPSLEEKVARYAGEQSLTSGLRLEAEGSLEGHVPPEWKPFLRDLARENPLSGKLGEAWVRQRTKRGAKVPPVPSDRLPWKTPGWWEPDRRQVAAMQVASVCRARMLWYGRDDILSLSGNHILVLLSMCRHVWAASMRVQVEDPGGPSLAFPIPSRLQSAGIDAASAEWHDKVLESDQGHSLQDLMDYLARYFRSALLRDTAISYPGRNGFSITRDQLFADENDDIYRFLSAGTDYGHLVSFEHSTKERDRRPRIKYYLRPILSPYYQLPAQHRQEPLYITAVRLRKLIRESREQALDASTVVEREQQDSSGTGQMRMFPSDPS